MNVNHLIAGLPADKLLLFAQALTIFEIMPTHEATQAVALFFGERLKPLLNIHKFDVSVKDDLRRDESDEVEDTSVGGAC